MFTKFEAKMTEYGHIVFPVSTVNGIIYIIIDDGEILQIKDEREIKDRPIESYLEMNFIKEKIESLKKASVDLTFLYRSAKFPEIDIKDVRKYPNEGRYAVDFTFGEFSYKFTYDGRKNDVVYANLEGIEVHVDKAMNGFIRLFFVSYILKRAELFFPDSFE